MSQQAVLRTTKKVLADLERAFAKHEVLEFQLYWVLNLTLLGMVKNVFLDVDMNRPGDDVKEVMRSVYDERKSDPIFKFINSDTRDRLVHQYKQDWAGEDYISYGYVKEGYMKGKEFNRPSFEGRHPIGLIEAAIGWWKAVVADIEQAVSQ